MSAISTVIDKSSFQALNERDLHILHRYFMHNVTPILVMEILGDLKKESATEKVSKSVVQNLANKMLPTNSVMNSNYMDLIKGELLGEKVIMDHRPLLGNAKLVEDGNGSLGMQIDESENEKIITRWKNGEFTDTDEILSQIWREVTTDKDLLESLKKAIIIPDDRLTSIKNTAHALHYINEMINHKDHQTQILKIMIKEFGINTIDEGKIFQRWEQEDDKTLETFSPYALFCIKIILTFHVALKKGFVGTRPTNKLDLEYLFYLPFCHIFVTSDKFQKMLVPLFLVDNQMMIDGKDLKEDLNKIEGYLSTVSERKDNERLRKEPPQIPEFLTYKIWSNFLDWPSKRPSSTESDKQRAIERLKEILNAQETSDYSKYKPGDEMDFITINRTLRDTDPCPCGSGKSIRECIITHQEY